MSILETRTLKGDSGVFQKMVDWILSRDQVDADVDVNPPQEEGEDAIVLFESHLACVAICTPNLFYWPPPVMASLVSFRTEAISCKPLLQNLL
jgi:hypothetical protein